MTKNVKQITCLVVVCLALLIVSCGPDKRQNQENKPPKAPTPVITNIDSSSFPVKVFTPETRKNNLKELTSVLRKLWTAKMLPPDMLAEDTYLGFLAGTQTKVYNFQPYLVATQAENWNHGFLVVTNNEDELIDFEEISMERSELLKRNEELEHSVTERIYTLFTSDSTFNKIRLYRDVKHYMDGSEDRYLDSIVYKYRIDPNGLILKASMDSIRLTK